MNFFFGGRGKEKEAKQSKREEEEAKYLRIHLHQLAGENDSLRQRLDDQKETALQNKKLLGTFSASHVALSRGLHRQHNNAGGSGVQDELHHLHSPGKGHLPGPDNKATQARYPADHHHGRVEKTRLESSKTTAETLGMSNRPAPAAGAQGDFCKSCGRLSPEAEINNARLLQEQERLLKEINAAKEEVAGKLADLKERNAKREEGKKDEPEGEAAGTLFNMKNLGSLQELLDQAEETEEMLIFVDKKQNAWEIVKRNDIDIANAAGGNGNDDEDNKGGSPGAEGGEEPGKNEDEGKKMEPENALAASPEKGEEKAEAENHMGR